MLGGSEFERETAHRISGGIGLYLARQADGLGRYLLDYGRSLLGGTWATLWGYFGWLEAPLNPAVYRVLYVVGALALVGLVWDIAHRVRAHTRLHQAPLPLSSRAAALGGEAIPEYLLCAVGIAS